MCELLETLIKVSELTFVCHECQMRSFSFVFLPFKVQNISFILNKFIKEHLKKELLDFKAL